MVMTLTEDHLASFEESVSTVDEKTQKGLNSRLVPQGSYSRYKKSLVRFNRWLVKRYQEELGLTGSLAFISTPMEKAFPAAADTASMQAQAHLVDARGQ